MATLAQRLHRRRKQQRLGQRHHLRLEALLTRLIPERGEIRRDDHPPGDDLGISATKRRDLRTEIVGQILEATGVGELEALLGQDRRETDGGVTPGIAVGIIGK